MKIMVELDSANARETFLLAEFLTKLSLIEQKTDGERPVGKSPLLGEGFDMSKIPPAGVPIQPTEDSQTAGPIPPPPPSNVVPLKPEIPPAPPVPGAVPSAPEYDTNGMPWDARIHASTKAKTIAGAWKNRRGVDEAERLAIEATLPRNAPPTSPAPPPASAIPPPPPSMGVTRVNGEVVPPGASIADAVAAMKAAPPPVPTSMAAPVDDDEADLEADTPPLPPAPPVQEIDFPTLMIKVSEAMGAGSMTLESVKKIINPLGVDTLFALSGRPDLVVPVAKALGFA
jgi:hypothetical protein